MTKPRRSFSAKFKRETAGLVLDRGYSHIEASRSLGVVESALRRWVNQNQQERNGVTPQSKALTPEQHRVDDAGRRLPYWAVQGASPDAGTGVGQRTTWITCLQTSDG